MEEIENRCGKRAQANRVTQGPIGPKAPPPAALGRLWDGHARSTAGFARPFNCEAQSPGCPAGPLNLDDGTFCIDDGTFCIDDGPFCIDDGPFCIDDETFCIDDESFCIDDKAFGIDDEAQSHGLFGPVPCPRRSRREQRNTGHLRRLLQIHQLQRGGGNVR